MLNFLVIKTRYLDPNPHGPKNAGSGSAWQAMRIHNNALNIANQSLDEKLDIYQHSSRCEVGVSALASLVSRV